MAYNARPKSSTIYRLGLTCFSQMYERLDSKTRKILPAVGLDEREREREHERRSAMATLPKDLNITNNSRTDKNHWSDITTTGSS